MLVEVKERLKITWNDEDEDLMRGIERGKSYLNDLVGADLDFIEEGQAKSLLLDYCRYYYNNALEYFEENFCKEITRLQFREAIKANAKV